MEGLDIVATPESHVFVCLACGRRSCDRSGILALNPGWNFGCARRAVLLPSSSLKLDGSGLVVGIKRSALLIAHRSTAN